MPNAHGDLNITEAAKYLGVSDSIMWSLYAAPGGPLFLLGRTARLRQEGPWFTTADLDQFRPRLPVALARIGVQVNATVVAASGAAKSEAFRA